jgi:hypothetical protein
MEKGPRKTWSPKNWENSIKNSKKLFQFNVGKFLQQFFSNFSKFGLKINRKINRKSWSTQRVQKND